MNHHIKLSDSRIPSLDGLRAVSILMVIGSHSVRTADFPSWMIPYSSFILDGNVGVRIFFVISGFLITWLLLREREKTNRIDLAAFYIRRVLRIFPVFYTFLLAVLVITNWIHRDFTNVEWLVTAVFTRNYYQGNWTLGHLWSISVEEQFYLIWPVTLLLLKNRKKLLVAALTVIAAAPIARVFLYVSQWRWLGEYSFFTQADSLMFGCLLAIFMTGDSVIKPWIFLHQYQRTAQFFFIAIIYLIWMLGHYGVMGFLTVPFGPTLQAAATACLMASVIIVRQGWLFCLLNLRVVAAIGTISYGLYIWQQIFLYPARYPDGDLWWRTFPQNIALSFLFAWGSYLLVEKPFLTIKAKFSVLNES